MPWPIIDFGFHNDVRVCKVCGFISKCYHQIDSPVFGFLYSDLNVSGGAAIGGIVPCFFGALQAASTWAIDTDFGNVMLKNTQNDGE